MSQPLPGTASAADAIKRVSYTHDAMIDLMVANPAFTGAQLAAHFGYTQAWISRVINSDAFNARLATRKSDLIDPCIVASIEEKFKALADKSLDIVLDKLIATNSSDLALKALDIAGKALGYGARQPQVAIQNNFVVALPTKSANAEAWVNTHNPHNVVASQ